MNAPLEFLSKHDAATVRSAVAVVLKYGNAIWVYDGEECALSGSTDAAAILAAMGTTEMDTLVYSPNHGQTLHSIALVYGNDPGETISDHSEGLESIIEEIERGAV